MGQKSNLLTIRNSFFSLISVDENSKISIEIIRLLSQINRLFEIKGILLINPSLYLEGNQLLFSSRVYYKSFKLTKLKQKKKLLTQLNFFEIKKNTFFSKLFNKYNFENNFFIYDFSVINKFLNSKLSLYLYTSFKKFTKLIFLRRYNLFLDFIKILSLYLQNFLTLKEFGNLLSQIFKYLPKRGHNKFIFFITYMFKILLDSNTLNKLSDYKAFKGVKFLLSGRISGKPRGSFNLIQLGSVPIQSIGKDVEYYKTSCYTLLGVFGIKIWVFK